MSQHLSLSDIQNYLDRTARPDSLFVADAHLAECEMCFAKIADLRSAQSGTASMLDESSADADMDAHLTYEQLTAYVDGDIGDVDREIVGVHTAVCQECTDQIAELQHLRSTLQLDAVEPAVSVGSRFGRFWNGIATGAYLRFAAPVFAVLLLGVISWSVWFLSRTQPVELVEVIDTLTEPPGTGGDEPDSLPSVNANSNTDTSKLPVSVTDSGTQIGIDDKGNLTGLNAPQFESRIKAALTRQNIDMSLAGRDLRARSGVLMGGEQPGIPFALTSPVGRIIESDRPQFRWRPLAGADSYIVTIYDANFNKVVGSETLRQPTWTPSVRLKHGAIYQWQVIATKDGQEIKSPARPAPDAKFRIIDAASAADIDAAKRTHPTSHLLLGIVYANAGLLDDAEREFTALLNQNPRSDIARKLLNKVRSARR